MQPGDRKRSAPSQRHACCDTQEESVDATNHKSVRLDSSLDKIVYEQDTASNPSRINIISLGDHDISPSHMDNDHNVQADSVCNTHSFEQPQRIQDTNSQMVTAPHVNNPDATMICFLQTVMPVTLHVGNLKVIDITLKMQTKF